MKLGKLMSVLFLFTALTASAQDRKEPLALTIYTNAVCDMCEKTIETELLYEKGVKAVDVDLEQNTINVKIDPKKTSLGKIQLAITKLGYSADGLSPDMAAREKLPDCCKKEGCGMPAHATPAPAPEEKH